MSEEITEKRTQTVTTKKADGKNSGNEKKGLNKWQKIAIICLVLLFIVGLILTFYSLLSNNNEQSQLEARRNEMKEGVVIERKENASEGIRIVPKGEIIDKDGTVHPYGADIVNGSEIVLSKDAKMAINIETGGNNNLPITVNGVSVKGGINVDGGIITYTDTSNVVHNVPMTGAKVTCGGTPVSDNVVNLMNNIDYDSGGNVIFSNMNKTVSFDNGQGMISYTSNDGAQYGTTVINNIQEKNNIYYSGNTPLSQQLQSDFSRADQIWDNKYPQTSGMLVQDLAVFNSNTLATNNAVSTNLNSTSIANAKG